MPDSNLFNQDDRSYLERLADDYGLDSRSTVEDYEEVALELLGKPGTLKAGMELAIGRELSNREFSTPPVSSIALLNDPAEIYREIREYDDIMGRAQSLRQRVYSRIIKDGSESEV